MTDAQGPGREPYQRFAGLWLLVLLLSAPVTRVLDNYTPTARLWSQPLATITVWAFFAVAVVMWVAYLPPRGWDRWSLAFFALMTVLSTWVVLLSVTQGSSFSSAAYVTPAAVLLICIKRPTPTAIRVAADGFAAVVLAFAVGVFVLQTVGIAPSRLPDPALAAFEDVNYWLPLNGLMGIDHRWDGYFGHPNIAAAAAVFLVVYGASRRGPRMYTFVGGGLAILLVTGTRSSQIAACVGLLLLLILPSVSLRVRTMRRMWIYSLALLPVAMTAWFLIQSPTLNSRTDFWPEYMRLGEQSPLTGVGDVGIGLAIEAGALPPAAVHGHSVLLDAFTRSGLVTVALVLAAAALAGVIVIRGMVRGTYVGAALLVSLIVGGLTESLLDWRYFNIQFVALLLAVLVVDVAPAQRPAFRRARPSVAVTATDPLPSAS